ncbi:histidine kinase [Tenacibaculum holothuriorum]|uniref:Histidine kinase n=1 Tax=Tenacibaculum holothuriorum TaxID=1635173 RepID=A0A1Y2PHV0_9FLAO|nr:histidine kinase [Tenacibaculum holothuriorum]OSY89289.1 histidine kinase [Tenacibaculum holothuriorum]
MNFKFPDKKKIFSMLTFRITLAVIGIIIVLFNDTFGKIEGFVEFLLLYFISVSIAVFHWLFVNIKFIINLKNEKAKTELMHLQSQVNPHFFFNMLNNLYGLVDKDSEKAKKLILKLSDMMRYSIYEGQNEYVTLQQEIDFINNYIELHKMRYHKNIVVNFEVDVEDENLKVMPLLFIILVENAFKHGVEVLRNNAFVHISIASKRRKIILKIENNFDQEEKSEKGIGLENLKRRLELAYPKKHKLISLINNNVYTAKLTINL